MRLAPRRSAMSVRRFRLLSVALAAALLAAGAAWALGFQLGETKEQLKLDYNVEVADHGTGRVTVTLTIADPGRLKPLTSVDLMIPSQDKSGYVDLTLPIGLRQEGGKSVARVHLKRDLAERAEIHLK